MKSETEGSSALVISKEKSPELFTLGIDSGSLTAKAVIMNGNREILSANVVQLEFVSKQAVEEAITKTLTEADLELDDMAYIVSTGYGRRRFPLAGKTITEISCHAKGAHYFMPNAKTVIDIGGQDSKVIGLDQDGNASNFAMNDRCAAGTGQFMEVMARALRIELAQVGDMSLQAQNKLIISSMCTVFAETEVISLVAEGRDKADILAAIHSSIAGRVTGLVGRVGLRQPVIMTGGVAKNIGMVRALEKELGVSIFVPRDPQIVGAVGAALFAVDYALAGHRLK